MPIPHHYDTEQNLITATPRGTVTARDFSAYVKAILADESIRAGFVEIIDLEQTEDVVASFRELFEFRELWERYLAKGCRATLIHAPTPLSYGVFRMFRSAISPDVYSRGSFEILRTREELEARLKELGVTPPPQAS